MVSGCYVLMMLCLYVWNRLQTSSNLRCCQCDQVIAIQGVRLPPVINMHYNVVVQTGCSQQCYPPLGASELGQTIVTTGHIPDLVDIERTETSMMNLDRDYSSYNVSKTVTSESYLLQQDPGQEELLTSYSDCRPEDCWSAR